MAPNSVIIDLIHGSMLHFVIRVQYYCTLIDSREIARLEAQCICNFGRGTCTCLAGRTRILGSCTVNVSWTPWKLSKAVNFVLLASTTDLSNITNHTNILTVFISRDFYWISFERRATCSSVKQYGMTELHSHAVTTFSEEKIIYRKQIVRQHSWSTV